MPGAEGDGHAKDASKAAQDSAEAEQLHMVLQNYVELDSRAKEALRNLSLAQVVKLLGEYEHKKPSIRNPSGFIYKTALRWNEGNMSVEEDPFGAVPQEPPEQWTPQQEMETEGLMNRHNLNDATRSLLRQLSHRTAIRILNDLESKGCTVRNPSAYCSTAARKARQRNERRQQRVDDSLPGWAADEQVVEVVNHYEALELEDTADEVTIKKAYRKLVLKWHPDKHPTDRDEAEERIRAINEAYEVLSNPTKKEAYDQQRRAVEQRRMGKVLRSTICVKTDLPRECMLQPVGYPDKFVRYRIAHGRGPQCFVQSRAEARRESSLGGDINLDDFLPFFEATKLSFWWLPEVNSMCRIRAAELGTRETNGEAVRAGRAGGLNLAFRIDSHESAADSAVKLMEARKGECKEMVNFIVLPSPYYEGAFRFEAAYHQGYFIAFRPPTGLRVVPNIDGSDSNCVIDFALIDFQHMFKFIELEEVLRAAMQNVTNWMSLDLLKMDGNVQAYFQNILGAPIWEDEDFQTYFSGHFDSWEYRADVRSVRLRTREERLGLELSSVATPEQMAQKIVNAADDVLTRLPWRAVRHSFEILSRQGSSEVSALLLRMEAKRKLIGVLGGTLTTAQNDAGAEAPPLGAIAGLAHQVHLVSGDPGLARSRDEALDLLVRHASAAVDEAEQAGRPLDLDVLDFAALVALPGMAHRSDSLLQLMTFKLMKARLQEQVQVLDAAATSGAISLTKAMALAVAEALDKAKDEELGAAVKALVKTDLHDDKCTEALQRCMLSMDTDDLALCVAALANRGNTSAGLAEATAALVARGPLAGKVPSDKLLSLAVGATKTDVIACVLQNVAQAAAATLKDFSIADVIRLLLAIAKAKGKPMPAEAKASLFSEAANMLGPMLHSLSTAEIIKVCLAIGSSAGTRDLMEAAASEAEQRLPGMPAPQLLLLTQSLASLGGGHSSVRCIVNCWLSILDPRRVGAPAPLSADQVVRLASILAPLLRDLNREAALQCLTVIGMTLSEQAVKLSLASRDKAQQLFSDPQGFGSWMEHEKLLTRLRDTRYLESSLAAQAASDQSRDASGRVAGSEADGASRAASREELGATKRGRDPSCTGSMDPAGTASNRPELSLASLLRGAGSAGSAARRRSRSRSREGQYSLHALMHGR